MRFPDGDVFSGHPVRLEDTPGHWWRSGPAMGQDTMAVLGDCPGFEPGEVDALITDGAAFTAAEPDHTLRRPYIDYVEVLGVHRAAP
jgi:hypothetical protein